MKHDLYDLFSEYRGELPEIEESSCDTGRIKQLVLKDDGEKPVKVRRKPKIFIISIAAAVTALTGITAAAYSDGFSRFREILRRTEGSPAISSELPLMHGEDMSGMEENISEEKIIFTGSGSIEVSTAGMYYDNNTLMLSVELKLNNGIEIPENSLVIPHFIRHKDGIVAELFGQGGIGNAALLVKGDEPDTYYATFYITEQDIAGSTIELRLENIIASDQPEIIQKRLLEEQYKWHEEYGFDDMTDREWKQFWKENDLDRRTRDFVDGCIEECEKILVGSWTAEINIPADIAKTLTAEKYGFRATADTLSLTLETERDLPSGYYTVPVVTMKDRTVIFTSGTTETEWLMENLACASPESHELFAYEFGNISSYSKPYPVEDIAEIAVYVFGFESGSVHAESYVIYEAEEIK